MKDDPRILLNFSALGGGTICDIIACLFDRKGISNYMIDIGGEMIAKGKNPQGWNCLLYTSSRNTLPFAALTAKESIHFSARVGSARTGTGCMNWYWPVAYTHLDVDKRQVYILGWVWLCYSAMHAPSDLDLWGEEIE